MVLGTVLGMMLLASASNLLMIYLALEMVSLPSYLLAGYLRGDRKSSEAGLKYVLFGAAASGGHDLRHVALLRHDRRLDPGGDPRRQLAAVPVTRFALLVAAGFVLAGFGFKIAMVPFHMWSPRRVRGGARHR